MKYFSIKSMSQKLMVFVLCAAMICPLFFVAMPTNVYAGEENPTSVINVEDENIDDIANGISSSPDVDGEAEDGLNLEIDGNVNPSLSGFSEFPELTEITDDTGVVDDLDPVEDSGEIVAFAPTSKMPTKAAAVAWLNAQDGASYDLDGKYGPQCVEFAVQYMIALWGFDKRTKTSGGLMGNANTWSAWAKTSGNLPDGWQWLPDSKSFLPQPGDIFISNYGETGHVGVVISSTLTTATIIDQNMKDTNYDDGSPAWKHNITWGSGVYNATGGYIRPAFASSNAPQGRLDSASGGAGTVSVYGWAFDQDTPSASVTIHVYIGGPAGTPGAECHTIYANKSRTDVHNVYGMGANHGFEDTITTSKRGSQAVHVYALDTGGGSSATNPQIGAKTITISEPTPVEKFVERLYTVVLNRASEPAGKKFHVDNLVAKKTTGADAAISFFLSSEMTKRNLSDSAFLDVCYKTFFDRAADSTGKKYWQDFLSLGMSRKYVLSGFINSTEFTKVCSSYNITRGSYTSDEYRDKNPQVTGFVNRLYRECLGRTGEVDGLNFHAKNLLGGQATGYSTAYGFVYSVEFDTKYKTPEARVTAMYKALLGRNPEKAGIDFWKTQTKAQIFQGMSASSEFAGICSSYGIKVK